MRALDARNRAFLMSPDGPEALRVREQFQDRVRIAQRISIVLFLIAGAVFITLVSAVNCEPGQTGGFCGTVSAPSHATVQLSQWAALALGGLYIGTAVLGRTHDRESERLDLIIEEGRRRRKGDDPFAGMSRVGWE